MKNLQLITIFIFGLSFLTPGVFSQGRGYNNMQKRIEELEKVKLIETLNLDETRTVQFFVKRKEFKQKQRDLTSQLDSIILRMQKLQDRPDKDRAKELINLFIEKEKQIHSLRINFIAELRNLLTEDELTRYLVFESEFRKDLQRMIMQRGKRNMREND